MSKVYIKSKPAIPILCSKQSLMPSLDWIMDMTIYPKDLIVDSLQYVLPKKRSIRLRNIVKTN